MLLPVLLLTVVASTTSASHVMEARQSSDGCGPNPLVAVMSYAREFADFSPHQLMRFIEMDKRAGNRLRYLLRSYDDCVRTGDGARYKRPSSSSSTPSNTSSSPSSKERSWLQDIQAWKRMLRTLVLNNNSM